MGEKQSAETSGICNNTHHIRAYVKRDAELLGYLQRDAGAESTKSRLYDVW